MPALHNLAVLGCAAAICLGVSTLGVARYISLNGLSSTNLLAALTKKMQATEWPANDQPIVEAAEAEPRGSLDYWRESNERRFTRVAPGAFVMQGRAPLPVTAERLAYERELFSRDEKNNMLVAKSPADMNRRIADAHAMIAGGTRPRDGKGQSNVGVAATEPARLANASMAAGPQKPKKKRVARARQNAPAMPPVLAFRMRDPFAMW